MTTFDVKLRKYPQYFYGTRFYAHYYPSKILDYSAILVIVVTGSTRGVLPCVSVHGHSVESLNKSTTSLDILSLGKCLLTKGTYFCGLEEKSCFRVHLGRGAIRCKTCVLGRPASRARANFGM